MVQVPTYDDVAAAAERIAGQAARTPVFTSRLCNEELGLEVFFKCESFQRTGAFKFRGAFNALSKLSAAQRRAGVVTYSSGNHAQALARAAQLLDIPAAIVMPHDAPQSKLEATKGYGGQIISYDRYNEDREQIATSLAEREGRTVIPPYDHPDVIAGQATATKELLEEVGTLDALFVPLGGGGLLAGAALAATALSPSCRLYGVEPEAGNDGQRSLRQGEIVHISPPATIADGAQTTHLGVHNFEILSRTVQDVLVASDADLVDAMKTFASRMKLVVEPTGCLGYAGLRHVRGDFRGSRVGVIVSGGNIDLERFAALTTG